MDLAIEALESARVGQVFRSRKNRVFRVTIGGETFIAKVFPPGGDDRAVHEHSALKSCVERGVRVPRPVGCSGRSLVMEYVEGKTAAESVDSDPADSEGTLLGVIDWLSEYHRAHDQQLCRGDSVLHNFLLARRGVVGIDLEESHGGYPIEDVGQVIASFLSMRPAFTEGKIAMVKNITFEYMARSGLDRAEDVPEAVSDALRFYAGFRADCDLLNAWAERIERGDLDLGQK